MLHYKFFQIGRPKNEINFKKVNYTLNITKHTIKVLRLMKGDVY